MSKVESLDPTLDSQTWRLSRIHYDVNNQVLPDAHLNVLRPRVTTTEVESDSDGTRQSPSLEGVKDCGFPFYYNGGYSGVQVVFTQ